MAEEVKKEAVFTREQLKNSKDFKEYKDLITVLVKLEEKVTKSECKKRIETFLKKKVK